jgi:hypothetical protein
MSKAKRNSKDYEGADFSPKAPDVKTRGEIIEFKEVSRENLRALVNKVIYITDIEFRQGRKGEFAIVKAYTQEDVDKNEIREREYYTFSRVVIRQLKDIYDEIMVKGKIVRARLSEDPKRGYLYLSKP